jgi:hypothetical protein
VIDASALVQPLPQRLRVAQPPEDDEEALAILNESSKSQPYVEVYGKWRNLGATVPMSLIRAGEAAKEADDVKQGE